MSENLSDNIGSWREITRKVFPDAKILIKQRQKWRFYAFRRKMMEEIVDLKIQSANTMSTLVMQEKTGGE